MCMELLKGLVNSCKENYLMRLSVENLKCKKMVECFPEIDSHRSTLYALLHFECLLSESMKGPN